MSELTRLKNRALAKLITRFPSLAGRFIDTVKPLEFTDVPWARVKRRLSESTVALVTTSGVHMRDDRPFDMRDKSGDPSFRVIDARRPQSEMMITHDYYDHSDADRDLNVVFPLERLWEMKKEGIIGELADLHYGLMGHVEGMHLRTLMEVTAPEVADRLEKASVDLVLLTPGWGLCNQSVGLVQREIESRGIPTVGISIVRKFTEKVRPPRTVFLRWPFGHPLGEPFNVNQQRAVIVEAFKALYCIKNPGDIVDLPFRWRRGSYEEYGERARVELVRLQIP